jgi:predicted nucleic acid-binding protein
VIVLDSSALVDLMLGDRDRAAWIEQRLDSEAWNVHAPHCIDIEVMSALRRLVSAGRVSSRTGAAVVGMLDEMRIVRYPHRELLGRIWELRAHVTAYDAAYVALAEALDVVLLTTDARLGRAHGLRARIDVYAA